MPTNLRSKLKSALTRDLPPPPAAPTRTYTAWQAPDDAYTPSEAEQRAEGARALAAVQRPPEPVYLSQHLAGGGP